MHYLLGLLGLCYWGTACTTSGAAPPHDRAERSAPAAAQSVRPGIEVLLRDSVHLIRGARVGLVTNQSGVDAQGTGTVERLRAAGVRLTALFSPEHGFRGAADPGAAVASTIDSATGLPIYSLYGRTSAPTPEMLAGVDVLLVDLQDAGARYYTYLSTTIEVMKATARAGRRVIVLDRPNPIGGMVQGNVLDTAHASFVGPLAVAMRHGMTLGELSLLAKSDLSLQTDLAVVPMQGWTRSRAWDDTGLPFIPPSPNLRTIESLFHYPGLCLFEGTALSVGRGSDAPFEQIGAPWLDTATVLQRLEHVALPGVRFHAVRFTPHRPGDQKFADTLVAGIRLTLTDRGRYDPTVTAVHVLRIIQDRHSEAIGWRASHFDRLAGGPALREAIQAGREPAEIARGWITERERFLARRERFLLYD